jgi:hypothetical protein
MVRYVHKSGGGGAPIETTSPVFEYGVITGNPKPPMTDRWPSDVWTAKLPLPKGERPKFYNDSTPPKYSESGAHFGFGPGKSASASTNPPKTGAGPLDQGVRQGIPNRNRFTQEVGRIGGGISGSAKGDRGVAYKDGEGRTKYRGRSG